ncbi:hypothetical protein V8B97DRAFT_1914160 [Scleroderma yunnanense]
MIAQTIKDKVDASIDLTIALQMTKIIGATEKLEQLYHDWKENKNPLQPPEELANDNQMELTCIEAHIQTLVVNVGAVQKSISELKNTERTSCTHNHNSTPQFYCDTVLVDSQTNAPSKFTKPFQATDYTKARSAIRDRQLLIDPGSDHPLLSTDSPKDNIMEIIQQALTVLEKNGCPKVQLKTLNHLNNHGIVLELNNLAVVQWIQSLTNRTTFIKLLGEKIHIKDHQYNVVVPFVPISTDLDSIEMLEHIEKINSLVSK